MAKRKTPKSATPASEEVSTEAVLLSPPPEVEATVPIADPTPLQASAEIPDPEAFATTIDAAPPVDAVKAGETAEIIDLSAHANRGETSGPPVKAEAKSDTPSPQRPNRVFLRVASIALAVAFGAAIGSLAPVALERMTSAASADGVAPDATIALAASVEELTAEFAALKAEGAKADRSAEARVAVLTERFDAAAKQQGELVARVAEIATTLAARPATAAAVSEEITGSVEPRKPAIVDGWTLWRVYNGRALVEGHGRLYDIVPGADLPGLGPVQRIQRSEGRWIVVTQNGIIVSRRG